MITNDTRKQIIYELLTFADIMDAEPSLSLRYLQRIAVERQIGTRLGHTTVFTPEEVVELLRPKYMGKERHIQSDWNEVASQVAKKRKRQQEGDEK